MTVTLPGDQYAVVAVSRSGLLTMSNVWKFKRKSRPVFMSLPPPLPPALVNRAAYDIMFKNLIGPDMPLTTI